VAGFVPQVTPLCGTWPRGIKYQITRVRSSFVSRVALGAITVVWNPPLVHERPTRRGGMPVEFPMCRGWPMETRLVPLEIGNCLTLASVR